MWIEGVSWWGFVWGMSLGFVGGFVLVLMFHIVSYAALDVDGEVPFKVND